MADSENTDEHEISTKGEEDTENVEEDEQKETAYAVTPSSTAIRRMANECENQDDEYKRAGAVKRKPTKKSSFRCLNLCRSVPFGNTLEIELAAFREWSKHIGEIEYYRYQHSFHSGLCFRQLEGRQAAAKADIRVVGDSWWLRVRKSEWKPGETPVTQCRHMWHIASLLKGVYQHAVETFRNYQGVKNNCNSWAKCIPHYLQNKWEELKKCEQKIIFEEFCEWADDDLNISVKTIKRLK